MHADILKRWIAGVAGAAGLLAMPAGRCAAQEAEPTTAPPATPPPRGADGSVLVDGEYGFAGALDGGGESSVARAGVTLTVGIPVGQSDRLGLDVFSGASFYRFDGAVGIDPAGGDPMDTGLQNSISLRYFSRADERWSWFVGAGIASLGETGASFADTLTYGGGGGVTYAFSKDFSLTGGVFVRTQLEDNVLVTPLVYINWQISEDLALGSRQRAAGSSPGLALTYRPAEQWSFWVEASYENRAFRLNDEGFNPDGVFRDVRVPVGAGASWKPAPGLRIEAWGGLYAWQQNTALGAGGQEIAQDDSDVSPFAGLGLRIEF